MAGLGLAFKAFFCCLKKSSAADQIEAILSKSEPLEAEDPKKTSSTAAQLLAAFQKEGRLIDFLREDLQGFADAQVGSVARGVQKGCRQVLDQYIEVQPVLTGDEGSEVTIPEGFDAHQISLVGKVEGAPPFTGVLRHHGWRLEKDKLPSLGCPGVLLPAEVELE